MRGDPALRKPRNQSRPPLRVRVLRSAHLQARRRILEQPGHRLLEHMADPPGREQQPPVVRAGVIRSHASAAHRRSVPRYLVTVRTCAHRSSPPEAPQASEYSAAPAISAA